MVLKKIFKI